MLKNVLTLRGTEREVKGREAIDSMIMRLSLACPICYRKLTIDKEVSVGENNNSKIML